MPATTESAFYRVAQEALANIARHARAQHAHVSLRRENGWLILEVTDDCAGFDVAQVMSWRQCSLGIWGMRERMALVGGELIIESQLGKGTRLIARAPIMSEGSNGYDKDTGVDRR